MSYLVLARKYRPQSFVDLVGQGHVTQTLTNAIAGNRVAHAFVFTGVRGVGKTTSARILAKCLNCLGSDGQAKGPTASPCLACAACTEIAGGFDLDVQEIDAASYNGVDEVRRLQEGLAFRPARDRFKIYIVDEVHMLSTAAWNAFLKTLEEPPPHVKFIFATTEIHKVPVTILSRCQRYDFKMVATRTIAARLREVLAFEKIEADDAAVHVLAREAAGSMRDAMSLLDQVIAFSEKRVTSEDVTHVLGVADREVLHKMMTGLVTGNAAEVLDVLNLVAQQGLDLAHFSRDLLHHARNLVVAKVMTEVQARELLDLADDEIHDTLQLASATSADDLTRIFQGLSRGFDEMTRSGHLRMALEMTLVRLARRPPLLPLDELLARIGELERRIGSGAEPPRGGGTTPGGAIRAREVRSLGASAVANAVTSAVTNAIPSAAPSAVRRTDGALALAEPVEATPLPIHAAGDDGADPIASFRMLVSAVREQRPDVASTLELAVPIAIRPDAVVLGFEQGTFENSRAADDETRGVVEQAVKALWGAEVAVSFETTSRGAKLGSIAYLDQAKRKQEQADARAALAAHPLVKTALSLFEAELKDIRLPTQED